jgi:NitT/TauT family transport system substrate-binding protein
MGLMRSSVIAAGFCLLGHAALAAQPVVVGTIGSASADLWPIEIGLAENFFAKQGLDVDLVFTDSSSAAIQQLAAQSLNMTVGSGLVDPMRAINQGANLAVVRIEMPYPAYSLMAKPSIGKISDLAGKTITIGGARDITRIYLERMLTPNGLETGHYDLIYAGATSARFSELESGAVDAALIAPPFNFKAQAAGFRNIGEALTYAHDLPFSGTVAERSWAAAHPEILRKFLAGETEAINWFYDPKNRDQAIKIMVDRFHSDPNDMAATYAYFRNNNMFDRSSAVTAAELQPVAMALQQTGDLPKDFDVRRVLLSPAGK